MRNAIDEGLVISSSSWKPSLESIKETPLKSLTWTDHHDEQHPLMVDVEIKSKRKSVLSFVNTSRTKLTDCEKLRFEY